MFKKIISLFLTLIMLMSSTAMQPQTAYGATIGERVTVETDNAMVMYGLYYGSPIGSALDYIVGEDGEKSYAYCIDHSKQGVSEVGMYDVTLQPYDDINVEAMLVNGFPNNKYGLTDKQAFYATKMAIVTYLEGWDITGWSAGTGGSSEMISAMNQIFNSKDSYTRPDNTTFFTIEKIEYVEDDEGNSETHTLRVVSSINENITINLNGEVPVGTKINGVVSNNATINTNEDFTISYAKPEGEYTRSFKVVINGKVLANNIVLGVPDNNNVQRYAITMQKTTGTAETDIIYKNEPQNEPKDGKLKIYKYENGTTIPLKGAKFELRSLNGEISNIYTTDSSGQIVIYTIPDGDYILNEVEAPKNYVIDYDFPLNVKIDSSAFPDGQEITIHNKKIPELTPKKVDGVTGKEISGAIFTIAYDGGNESTDITSGEAFQPSRLGTYTVSEKVAPSGYQINPITYSVKVDGINPIEVVIPNFKYNTIIPLKVDEKTGLPLEGAEFEIKHKDGSIVWQGVTDSQGTIINEALTNLENGWYTITELAPPKNYIGATEPQDVYVSNGQTVQVKFDNREKPSLKIKKIDSETGEALAGATFKIWATEGASIIEKETDKNGEILLEHLDEGIYSVQEINAPTGYVTNNEIKNIKLEWSNTDNVKEIVFTNSKKPSLIITKHDQADGSLLPNAEFSITTKEGDIIWEGLTDKDGQIALTDLDEGWYTISEMQPPLNYMFGNFASKDVYLTANETVTVKFDNKLKPSLLIKKIDKVTGEPIQGVTFKITHPDGKTVTEKMTDEKGEILLEYVPEGVYRVEEIAVPNGYILNSEAKDITIEWTAEGNVKELIFENILKPTLVINKTSGLGGFGLSGAKFEVEYRQNDGGLKNLGTFTTNSVGQIVLPYVNEGWYRVTEVKAPLGYQLPSNPTKEIYLSAGENSYSEIKEPNQPNTGDISVSNGGSGSTYTPSSSEMEVTYGSEIPEIANLFETNESVVYSSSIDFDNYPLNSIVIKKTDAITGRLLSGATFELIKVAEGVSGSGGTTIGTFSTDYTGVIVITGLTSGHYVVRESQAPINYDLNVNNQQQAYLAEDGTSIVELMFGNYPYGRLVINKMDADTKEPLANATFEVTNSKGEYVGTAGNGHYTSDVEGNITLDNLKPDSYVITEIKAPENYAIDQENNVKVVEIGYGETKEVNFYNKAYSTLVIRKLDTDTKEPLADAEFKVTTSTGEVVGSSNGIFVTDENGLITITDLPVGNYIATEVKAPNNYILTDNTQSVNVRGNSTHTLTFYNTKKSSAQILKIDSETKEPLKGAEFKLYKANGELVNTYKTDSDGLIILPHLENGWYKILESKAPSGYIIDDTAQDFEIKGNQFVKLVFENKKMTSLIIKKISDSDGSPLAGATFVVEKQNGEFIGEYTTSKDGLITIPELKPDWYVIKETVAPKGYLLNETPKTVEIKTNVPTVVTFTNKLKSGLQIIKIDSITGEPLSGAEFTAYKKSGDIVGNFTTSKEGVIIIDGLENGWYKVAESKAPVGYKIDETPKDVELKGDEFHKIVFANTPMGGLKIIKTNSNTGEPIANVEFEISKMNGERVLNESNGTKFVTDSTGQIYLPNLADGNYTVTETKQAEGYFIDPSPKNVIVTAGKPTILEVPNTPASGLLIIKTDEESGKPLAGVEFDILRADGSRVTADILDKNQSNTENNSPNKTVNGNGAVNGSFTTDSQGRIYLNHLAVGEYNVIETKALDGYELDNTVHSVTVREGKQETLKVTNKQLSSILLRKIDADTKEGLMGARFVLYNEKGTPIGEFRSDNEGYVHIDRELQDGKYYIEEVEAPAGYVVDSQRKTIYVQQGRTTSIIWENRLLAGQIQITKRSSDYNDVTKLPAGSPLEGAVFEIYNTKNNVVDVITTDYRGVGASKGLPVGVYFLKEIQAPQYYALNDKEMWVEISHDGDIVKLDVLNKSLYLDVNVRKQGPTIINAGETLTYHITDVRNNSNSALTNFIIHDQIPVGALRIEKIITGTFNERANYSIMYKTNKSGEYKVLASNLLSKNSYEFSLHPNVLGLAQDEFITDVKMEFPRVSSGFASLTSTELKMYVLPTTTSGYEITNMATAGGYAGSTFEHAISTWKTVVEKEIPKNPMPRTGY